MAVGTRSGQYQFRTGDQALVRQINLAVVMHHLRENAPVSRAALAEITGLNKTTVSSLVRELIDRQFVSSAPAARAPPAGTSDKITKIIKKHVHFHPKLPHHMIFLSSFFRSFHKGKFNS